MIIDTSATIYGNPFNVKRYLKLGYDIKYGEYIDVKIEDLPDNYGKNIKLKCDYCGEIFFRKYSTYVRGHKTSPIKKDACKNCYYTKQEESMLLLYGVKNSSQVEQFKDKARQTLREHYGVDTPMHSKEIVNKVRETNMQKYGTPTPAQNKEILKKIQDTNIIRYGSASPLQNEKVRQKSTNTILDKYGVDNVMKNEQIKEKTVDTCLKKYGCTRAIGTTEIKDKIKNTNVKNMDALVHYKMMKLNVKLWIP